MSSFSKNKVAYMYLLITFLAWGSLYVVSKFVLDKIPVITVSFIRYVIAGAVLYFILKQKKLKSIQQQDYKYVFLIGFLGYFVSMATQLLGTKLTSASLAALVNSVNPVMIMLFAVVILKERLTLKKAVCGILAIAGVYIIVGGVDGRGQIWGILISIFSVVLWSWVSVAVRKITQKYDALQITTYAIIIAAICTMPFSLWELSVSSDVQFDGSVMLAILYIGLVCTALSHVLWNKSLSMIEAGTCSLFYPLQPMVAVLLGGIFLGESISANFVFGAILIICGVMFSIIGSKE
ncbi:MAG: DMT(drug/metabolite transporter) superfamily permease [Firmicutes bacterium]|nr:DMT(drug/metabolite transporter) superfamily permease [Bacillota bacterium]